MDTGGLRKDAERHYYKAKAESKDGLRPNDQSQSAAQQPERSWGSSLQDGREKQEVCGFSSWSITSFYSGSPWCLSPTLGQHVKYEQVVGNLGDYEIFLLRNRLLIYRVKNPLESKEQDLLLVKYEGCNMIALQISLYIFTAQEVIASRGVPLMGQGKNSHWEGFLRPGRAAGGLKRRTEYSSTGRRQTWVGPPKGEGSENKETTGTDRR